VDHWTSFGVNAKATIGACATDKMSRNKDVRDPNGADASFVPLVKMPTRHVLDASRARKDRAGRRSELGGMWSLLDGKVVIALSVCTQHMLGNTKKPAPQCGGQSTELRGRKPHTPPLMDNIGSVAVFGKKAGGVLYNTWMTENTDAYRCKSKIVVDTHPYFNGPSHKNAFCNQAKSIALGRCSYEGNGATDFVVVDRVLQFHLKK
jgi:hypothetical protein